MFRRGISNVLLILILFLIVSCMNKSGYQFSRRYSPIYNPGGEAFDSNVEFSRAYSIYKERRDALVSGIGKKDDKKKNTTKYEVKVENIDQLVEKALSEEKDNDFMIDSNGINLVDVAGAKFIDPNNDGVDNNTHSNNAIDKHIKVGGGGNKSKVINESKDKSSNTKDKKPEVSSGKIPIITKNEDKVASDIKDKKSEVSSGKIPVITKNEDKVASNIKDKKSEVSSGQIPVITKNEDKVASNIKDKKPEVSSGQIPVITKNEDKVASDIKDKKSEVSGSKVPVLNVEDNTHQNNKEDSNKQPENEELVSKHRDSGLRSLLKFSKDDDKQKNVGDDLNNPVLLKPESDSEQLQQHDSEENNKQKHTHKAVHFLSFLKEPENVKEEVQEIKHDDSQDNNGSKVDSTTSSSLNMEKDVKVIDEQDSTTTDHSNQNKQMKNSQEKNNTPMDPMEQIEDMNDSDEEDYTVTYYYDDENIASYY